MKNIAKTITVILAVAMALGTLTACTQSKKKTKKRAKPTPTPVVTTVGTDETTEGTESSQENNLEDWSVWERDNKGVKFLQIQNSGFHVRQTEMDYLLFWVYDSEAEAKKAYKNFYKESKEYDRGNWQEGDNWFISDEPGVCDASIVWMNYLEGNIIISAQLEIRGCMTETTEPTAPVFDRSTLKDYILNNVPEIVRFVNEDLLGK